MDTVAIPLFSVSAKPLVVEAIDLLRRRQRAGLILEELNEYRLLYIRHLLEARRDRIEFLAGVNGGYPVHLLKAEDAKVFDLDMVLPTQTRFQYEQFFHSGLKGKDYILAGATADTAIIVTREERLKDMLGDTGGFQCNGLPLNHFFPDPDVVNGQACPKYPECTLLGGGRPVISPV